MKLLFWELFLLEICYYSLNVQAANKTIMCHFNAFANNRKGNGRFVVDNIDPNMCTHMVYFRLYLDLKENKITKDSNFLSNHNGHVKFTKLKETNSQLKCLIYLQLNPTMWNATHVEMLVNGNHGKAIARNIVGFLQLYKFDGIVLLFLPSKEDKLAFMSLVKSIKQAFLPFGYIFSVPVYLHDWLSNDGFDIQSLSRDVDFLILNAYDFHTPEEKPNRADHHTPLYSRPWDTGNGTVDLKVTQWINRGFPPEKIILTIVLLGRSWTLSSADSTIPAPAIGPGPPGIYTREKGFMSYFEICFNVLHEEWQVFQDPEKRMGPYAVSVDWKNKTWVSYDDPDMAVVKSEYILSKGLGGVAVFDITMDDFRNKCGGGRNPMLTAIWKTLFPPVTTTLPNITLTNITLPGITSIHNEELLFRLNAAFIFSSIVSSFSFLTIIYMLYWLYRLGALCKCCYEDYYVELIYDL